jgi:hypothetical protein
MALLGGASQAFAWGERGHHTVCEVATKLVTNTKETAAFARFMLPKGHMMGHVCNLPDISWRSLPTPADADDTIVDPRVGDEAHFINPENFGFKKPDGSPNTGAIPLDFFSVEQLALPFAKADKNGKSPFPHQLTGSNWWRTRQLHQRAIDQGSTAIDQIEELVGLQRKYDSAYKGLKKAEKDAVKDQMAADKEAIDKQKDEINHSLRNMLIAMGLMGHFVGDAGQPFHNSADYNGKLSGHYGIHSYYESKIVDQIDAALPGLVYLSASKDKNGVIAGILADTQPESKVDYLYPSVLTRMRKVSAMAGLQMPEILSIEEAAIKKQEAIKHDKPLEQGVFTAGKGSKEPENRPYADALSTDKRFKDEFRRYRAMIVGEIGVSAKVLATFWDEIFATLNQKAKETGKRLATSTGDQKLAYLDITKYYTTYDYPLDTGYIAPDYLKLSLKSLPGGMQPPPPPAARALPILRELGESDEDGISIHTELGDLDDDARLQELRQKRR